jgi:hypothetical protein
MYLDVYLAEQEIHEIKYTRKYFFFYETTKIGIYE